MQLRMAATSTRSLAPVPTTGISMHSTSTGAAPSVISTTANPPLMPGSMPRTFTKLSVTAARRQSDSHREFQLSASRRRSIGLGLLDVIPNDLTQELSNRPAIGLGDFFDA